MTVTGRLTEDLVDTRFTTTFSSCSLSRWGTVERSTESVDHNSAKISGRLVRRRSAAFRAGDRRRSRCPA